MGRIMGFIKKKKEKKGHIKYVVLIILCAEKYFVFFHGTLKYW